MKEFKILYIFWFQDIGEYIVVAKILMQNTKLFLNKTVSFILEIQRNYNIQSAKIFMTGLKVIPLAFSVKIDLLGQ